MAGLVMFVMLIVVLVKVLEVKKQEVSETNYSAGFNTPVFNKGNVFTFQPVVPSEKVLNLVKSHRYEYHPVEEPKPSIQDQYREWIDNARRVDELNAKIEQGRRERQEEEQRRKYANVVPFPMQDMGVYDNVTFG